MHLKINVDDVLNTLILLKENKGASTRQIIRYLKEHKLISDLQKRDLTSQVRVALLKGVARGIFYHCAGRYKVKDLLHSKSNSTVSDERKEIVINKDFVSNDSRICLSSLCRSYTIALAKTNTNVCEAVDNTSASDNINNLENIVKGGQKINSYRNLSCMDKTNTFNKDLGDCVEHSHTDKIFSKASPSKTIACEQCTSSMVSPAPGCKPLCNSTYTLKSKYNYVPNGKKSLSECDTFKGKSDNLMPHNHEKVAFKCTNQAKQNQHMACSCQLYKRHFSMFQQARKHFLHLTNCEYLPRRINPIALNLQRQNRFANNHSDVCANCNPFRSSLIGNYGSYPRRLYHSSELKTPLKVNVDTKQKGLNQKKKYILKKNLKPTKSKQNSKVKTLRSAQEKKRSRKVCQRRVYKKPKASKANSKSKRGKNKIVRNKKLA